jgi:biopolymer transport protein ExbD
MSRAQLRPITSGVQLPIVPMLDVTFQLLAFFIMTYHPSTLTEGAVEFNLPSQGRAQPPEQVMTPLSPDDFQAPVTVLVEGFRDDNNAGHIRSIRVDTLTGSITARDTAALKATLRQVRDAGTTAPPVQIRVETCVAYTHVFDVVDACIAAGYDRVGFALPPDLEEGR